MGNDREIEHETIMRLNAWLLNMIWSQLQGFIALFKELRECTKYESACLWKSMPLRTHQRDLTQIKEEMSVSQVIGTDQGSPIINGGLDMSWDFESWAFHPPDSTRLLGLWPWRQQIWKKALTSSTFEWMECRTEMRLRQLDKPNLGDESVTKSPPNAKCKRGQQGFIIVLISKSVNLILIPLFKCFEWTSCQIDSGGYASFFSKHNTFTDKTQ